MHISCDTYLVAIGIDGMAVADGPVVQLPCCPRIGDCVFVSHSRFRGPLRVVDICFSGSGSIGVWFEADDRRALDVTLDEISTEYRNHRGWGIEEILPVSFLPEWAHHYEKRIYTFAEHKRHVKSLESHLEAQEV